MSSLRSCVALGNHITSLCLSCFFFFVINVTEIIKIFISFMSTKWDVWLKEPRTMSAPYTAHEPSECLWNLMYLTITTHLLSKHVWNVCHRSGTKLGAGNTVMNKTKNRPCPYRAYNNTVGETITNPSNHTHECRIKTALYVKKSLGKGIFIGSFHLVRDGGGKISEGSCV